MSNLVRERDVMSGQPGPEYWESRRAAGWMLGAVEWVREVDGNGEDDQRFSEVPYGLQVAGDCSHLEENRTERQALILMLDLIRQDKPLSQVADEMNGRGFRTRQGRKWGIEAVFHMLPRLIEAGPGILSSREWERREISSS